MGYTIAVRCKTHALQQKMFEFLRTHFKSIKELLNSKMELRPIIDGFSYDDNKLSIGFNYHFMLPLEYQYIYCLLYWVALKIGRRRYFVKEDLCAPYLMYDGSEAWPIVVGKRVREKGWPVVIDKQGKKYRGVNVVCVDEIGFNKIHYTKIMGLLWKGKQKLIHAELQRLETCWEFFVEESQTQKKA